jgi:hypothetical protein
MGRITELTDRVSLTQRNLDALQRYLDNPPPGVMGVTIDWTWGSTQNEHGKVLLRQRIQPLIEVRFGDMAGEVYAQVKKEAADALEELRAYLEESR